MIVEVLATVSDFCKNLLGLRTGSDSGLRASSLTIFHPFSTMKHYDSQ